MYLRRLSIRALPGIEPGFTFEPRNAGVNLVVGPNAIGKSSLARALGYLLASHASDPPALSLEAELEGDDARWQVSRDGHRILWRRNGEAASRPVLPGADRIGLFRLSVEHLLDDDDANDRELAGRLWRELRGNFDLNRPRIEITPRFAQHEARRLAGAGTERRRVEGDYVELQRREAELPDLERRIEEAVAAGARREHLEQALELADAIDARKAREAALQGFPADMDRLRGDEIERLDEMERKARALHDDLRDRQRDREAAVADLDRTGLAQSSPEPEAMHAAEERLRRLGEQAVERGTAHAARSEADAELRDTAAQFRDTAAQSDDAGDPPRLDAGACRKAEEIAIPLIAEQARRRLLKEQLDLAGEAPAPAEIDRQRGGVEALRAWLAGNAADAGRARAPSTSARITCRVAQALAVFAIVTAYIEGALVAFAGALASLLALGLWLFLQRVRRPAHPSPTAEARRRFNESDLSPPPQWDEHAVRRHLREKVESRLNELTLRRERAAGSERIAHEIRETDEAIEALEARRVALAAEIGFDPRLPVAELQRFVHLCSEWDRARASCARHDARLEHLDREMADTARLVGDFLGRWRTVVAPAPGDASAPLPPGRPALTTLDDATPAPGDASGPLPPGRPALTTLDDATPAPGDASAPLPPDPISLRCAFDDLKRRMRTAEEADHRIRACASDIRSLEQRMAEVDTEVETLFTQAGVESRDRAALAGRIERLAQWREARDALRAADAREHLVRDRLAEQPGLVALAESGERARMQAELDASRREADEHALLIEERTRIETRLNDAGKDRKLEQAAAEEGRARQDLEDRRDEALLAAATRTLLDDVEQAFEAEHEPVVLRRARRLFEEVTARAFDLRLRGDGTFIAHDVRLDAPRALSELSSGTRMQLLLALRVAWIETLEQGGETLPLFLDEALTTSDETRFAVVAQSLERLAGRQIFYLSARRHEPALWRQATGAEPAVIDLAAVRFPSHAFPPEVHAVETPPSLPAPNGRSAGEYASLLGVPPRPDPHRPEGGIHLFHLLRDDLPLLHALMDTWRIGSLGQLEGLLASDAAQTALPAEDLRRRLGQRCRTVRTWVELWRQGRGRPVDRGVLEQCSAISATFIDRVADLAGRVQGDGESLVRALRAGEVERFRRSRIDALEQWLADEGFTDDQERLSDEDRRRLTLQRLAPESAAEASDVNLVVGWLEAKFPPGHGGDRALDQ